MSAYVQAIKTQDQAASDRSIKRIKQLMMEEMSYEEMAATLNAEGYQTIRLKQWTALNIRQVVYRLRHELATWYGLSARRANFVVKELMQ